jgi:hypothetical protein
MLPKDRYSSDDDYKLSKRGSGHVVIGPYHTIYFPLCPHCQNTVVKLPGYGQYNARCALCDFRWNIRKYPSYAKFYYYDDDRPDKLQFVEKEGPDHFKIIISGGDEGLTGIINDMAEEIDRLRNLLKKSGKPKKK